jgi:hypothetical protein
MDAIPPDLPLWIDESNSAIAGGLRGISNSRASTLWGFDFLLRARAAGADQVDLHVASGLGCDSYSPLCLASARDATVGAFTTTSVWLGLLAADRLGLDGRPQLLADTDRDVVWATPTATGPRLVVLNMSPRPIVVRIRTSGPTTVSLVQQVQASDPAATTPGALLTFAAPTGVPVAASTWLLHLEPDSALTVARGPAR